MRNVLVTGGSRGLGLGIVRLLAARGYRAIAVARSESEGLRAAREAPGEGEIHFTPFDLSDLDGLADLAKAIKAEHGPLWGLVNNAGIGTGGVLANMKVADIEALVRLNTLSPIVLTRAVVKQMLAQGGGRIVNMSSIIASTGYANLSVYAATKASMTGFTRSLAREMGRVGVTVNAVAPGFVDTELTSELDGAARERVVNRAALRRLAEVDDVAEAVAFLLGDGAKNITGTVMTVDAGSTA